jgi:SAM-dependent methyltransferase
MNEQIYGHRWDRFQLANVEKVWRVLTRDFFQAMISPEDHVLDIGCGFCHFLNNIDAAERVGVDANPDAGRHAREGVRFVHTADLLLRDLPERHFDFIFISNFLEHLDSSKDVLSLLTRVRQLVSDAGQVVILQPNFRLLGHRYFDFIDHKTILTDTNLQEALECCGFSVKSKRIRFLPYTTKSRLPMHPLLVKLYLKFRPAQWLLGKQSLFVATAARRSDGSQE